MLRKMTSNAGMVQIPFPEPISLIYNPLENIRYFQEQWKYYCVAAGLDKSPEEKKIAILYLLIGREAFLFITNNLMLTDEEQRTSDGILQALENNFKPKVNVVYERFIFNQAVQDENENIDSFVNKLKKLASKCDFKEKFEEMIRDRFLVGLRNLLVQKELLADSELTLQKAITLTKNKEQNTNELQTLYYKIGIIRCYVRLFIFIGFFCSFDTLLNYYLFLLLLRYESTTSIIIHGSMRRRTKIKD